MMSDAMAALLRAKVRLKEMDTLGAINSLKDFEKIVQSGKILRSDVGPCSAELEKIQILAGSARDGIEAAISHISDIIIFSQTLGTYSRHGEKLEHSVGKSRNQKY